MGIHLRCGKIKGHTSRNP